MKNLLPYALCLILFFVGRLTAPKPDKELKAKYEQERDAIMEVIGQKDGQISRLNEDAEAIKAKFSADSAIFMDKLLDNQRAYSALKRKYNEINLNRADAQSLDSIISRLYPD
jgi:hypothetical protein